MLEPLAIIPQLMVLQRYREVENLTGGRTGMWGGAEDCDYLGIHVKLDILLLLRLMDDNGILVSATFVLAYILRECRTGDVWWISPPNSNLSQVRC